MSDPERVNRGPVYDHVVRSIGAVGGGIGEVSFSLTLAAPKALAPRSTATGQITWSFIANPKLELVDMYVDLV